MESAATCHSAPFPVPSHPPPSSHRRPASIPATSHHSTASPHPLHSSSPSLKASRRHSRRSHPTPPNSNPNTQPSLQLGNSFSPRPLHFPLPRPPPPSTTYLPYDELSESSQNQRPANAMSRRRVERNAKHNDNRKSRGKDEYARKLADRARPVTYNEEVESVPTQSSAYRGRPLSCSTIEIPELSGDGEQQRTQLENLGYSYLDSQR